ncbi:MAG: DUF2793 domain-containing protein [Cohaesibacter sp.]|nr:DUF2793 domain-containing protein [Cohaesibacter sp.]
MADTDLLKMPYIAASQDQKHVTHNEALRMLDALVQLCVKSITQTSAPSNPTSGDRYIVASGATGAWAGKDNQIAAYQDGAWTFFAANNGWVAFVEADDKLYAWKDDSWIVAGGEVKALQNATHIGVQTTADDTNRLSVSSEASLFNHAGAGHQVKVNKNASGDTGSFLFQINWSGRAEIGLTGSDNFEFKVSADGSNWHQAMTIHRDSGVTELGAALKLKQYSVAGLPDPASVGSAAVVYVYDASGGAVMAFSDGGSWRRSTDATVVS